MSFCGINNFMIFKYLLAFVLVVPLMACSVEEGSGGETDLTWVAPSEREDGSALSLSEIGSYRIYYGTDSGDYQEHITITDGSEVQAKLVGIPPGTYYAVMTALDTAGRESRYSPEVVITL